MEQTIEKKFEGSCLTGEKCHEQAHENAKGRAKEVDL
jgi:hypothetical protein